MPSRFVTSTKAPTHPGRFRGVSPLGLGGSRGGAFLPDVFPAGRQTVEAAFGADVNSDPELWVWTDITTYCLWDPGTNARIGYPNESAGLVPAEFTVSIRNDQPNGGWFTYGNPLSPLWPDVSENTPIRHILDIGYGSSLRFEGYATSWTPEWDVDGDFAVTQLIASGVHRRVRQGESPKKSPIRRFFDTGDTRPVAYWSLEDNSGATQAASAIPGGAAMTASGGGVADAGVQFGAAQGRVQPSYTGYEVPRIGTRSFVSLAEGGSLSASLPVGNTNTYSMHFIGTSVATTGSPGAIHVLARWLVSSGSFVRYDVRSVDGAIELLAYNSAGASTTLCDSGGFPLVDEWEYIITLSQSGANVNTSIAISQTLSDLVVSFTDSDSRAGTMGIPTYVSLNPDQATADRTAVPGAENITTDIKFAHLAVWYGAPLSLMATVTAPLTGTLCSAWNGFVGEAPSDRMVRLGAEENIQMDIVGSCDMAMSIQSDASFFDLVLECVGVDQGLLFDGLGPGYTYIARTELYGQAVQMTLDSTGGPTAGDIMGPTKPQNDDQSRVNVYEASNPDGAQGVRFEKSSGTLGIDKVGIYDSSGAHHTYDDGNLYQIAAWKVGQGIVSGLRFPRLEFELSKPNSSLKARDWLSVRPFSRIRTLGLARGQADTNVDSVVRGWMESTNSKTWRIVNNVSPYGSFDIVSLANPTGSNDDTVGWLDPDIIVTQDALAAGGSSVACIVIGPVMTNPSVPTYADDLLGLYINLDGMKVGVTAISGTSSPQTISVNGADVLRSVPAGSSVSAWDVATIGL